MFLLQDVPLAGCSSCSSPNAEYVHVHVHVRQHEEWNDDNDFCVSVSVSVAGSDAASYVRMYPGTQRSFLLEGSHTCNMMMLNITLNPTRKNVICYLQLFTSVGRDAK